MANQTNPMTGSSSSGSIANFLNYISNLNLWNGRRPTSGSQSSLPPSVTCLLCRENIVDQNQVYQGLSCTHKFHVECIKFNNNECSVCSRVAIDVNSISSSTLSAGSSLSSSSLATDTTLAGPTPSSGSILSDARQTVIGTRAPTSGVVQEMDRLEHEPFSTSFSPVGSSASNSIPYGFLHSILDRPVLGDTSQSESSAFFSSAGSSADSLTSSSLFSTMSGPVIGGARQSESSTSGNLGGRSGVESLRDINSIAREAGLGGNHQFEPSFFRLGTPDPSDISDLPSIPSGSSSRFSNLNLNNSRLGDLQTMLRELKLEIGQSAPSSTSSAYTSQSAGSERRSFVDSTENHNFFTRNNMINSKPLSTASASSSSRRASGEANQHAPSASPWANRTITQIPTSTSSLPSASSAGTSATPRSILLETDVSVSRMVVLTPRGLVVLTVLDISSTILSNQPTAHRNISPFYQPRPQSSGSQTSRLDANGYDIDASMELLRHLMNARGNKNSYPEKHPKK